MLEMLMSAIVYSLTFYLSVQYENNAFMPNRNAQIIRPDWKSDFIFKILRMQIVGLLLL